MKRIAGIIIGATVTCAAIGAWVGREIDRAIRTIGR